MRFLIDECVGTEVVYYLRSQGYDSASVTENLPSADDRDVLSWAVREDRILITNDTDFGELVFRDGYAHRGLVLLRLKDDHGANQVRILVSVLSKYPDQLAGHFVVVTDDSVRIRFAP